MNDFQDGSRRPQTPSFQRTIQPVLWAVGLLWALIGLSAWLFPLDAGEGQFASLAILVVSLVAGTLCMVFRNRAGAPTATAPTPSFTDARRPGFLADSVTDERIATLGGQRWSLDVFAAIDAQRFAAVCETWFSWAGFETRSETHRTNEGVDIWLHAARMPGPVAIVRCCHWLNKPVGLQDMKDFLGLVASCKSAHGTFTTTSTYTPEALQFAREHGLDAVDGRSLLRRIQTRTRQRQQALLAVAYHGHS